MKTEENGIQAMEDVPDWTEDAPAEVDPDEPNGLEDFQPEEAEPVEEVSELEAIEDYKADLHKIMLQVETFLQKTERISLQQSQSVNETNNQALTKIEEMQAVMSLVHNYMEHDLPGVIERNFEAKGDIVFQMNVDFFKDQIKDTFGSAVQALDENIQKSAVAAETVRVLLWQQFLKQTIIAGIVSAVVAVPVAVFICKTFFK